ncbi:MAG: hypothetical protein ACOZNI_26285 [Myxococcota bacterium]
MDSRHTLLVVGNPDDIGPIVEGLREAAPQRVIEEASTLEAVAATVEGWRTRLESGDVRGPDLVLLDVVDPRVDVPRLVRLIRATIDHKVAIVVLVPEPDESFVRDCLLLTANAVARRPAEPARLREVAAAIGRYWLTLNAPAPAKPTLQSHRRGT